MQGVRAKYPIAKNVLRGGGVCGGGGGWGGGGGGGVGGWPLEMSPKRRGIRAKCSTSA